VVVRRAKSREELRPTAPRVEKAQENVSWAEVALEQETARRGQEQREGRE
jgi:hypothetical protein